MKHRLFSLTALLLTPLAPLCAADQPAPKVTDKLKPNGLNQSELSGEIGRRIQDVIYKNWMAINETKDFADPFRLRPPREGRYLGVGKHIAAGSRFAAYTGDKELAKRNQQLIDDVWKTRDPDGYVGALPVMPDKEHLYRKWTIHEQEYLLLALVENYLYCGNAESLQRARELADWMIATYSDLPNPEQLGTLGLPEALLKLYGCTGEEKYKAFAATWKHGGPFPAEPLVPGRPRAPMIEVGSLVDWKKKDLKDKKVNHVYANLARCYSQALLYRWQPQDELLGVSRLIKDELAREDGCLQVTGNASQVERFDYAQPGAGNCSESCATAYMIRWLNNLMELDGDLRSGDLMERAIYNALFAAQEPAGRKIRYFTPFEGPREYYKSDGYCCPPNHRRIMAELPEMVYYRTDDGGVAVNLFTQSKKTIELLDGGRSVTIEQQTDYPSSGSVKIVVTPSQPMEFPLRLRIPRWCPKATLTVAEGAPQEVTPGQPYFEVRRTWKPGDVVTLDMPMPWRWVQGKGDQKGRAALLRGPVVYCLGTAANAELLAQFEDPREITIDPSTLGEPVPDTTVRPGGLKVTAKVWPPFHDGDENKPATLDVVLTEFVDPTGIATFFKMPDEGAPTVVDELTAGGKPESNSAPEQAGKDPHAQAKAE